MDSGNRLYVNTTLASVPTQHTSNLVSGSVANIPHLASAAYCQSRQNSGSISGVFVALLFTVVTVILLCVIRLNVAVEMEM